MKPETERFACSLFDLPPPTIWKRLHPRYDCSIWQAAIRSIRGPFRRMFYPNGPAWFKHRFSSIEIIKALQKCNDEEAAAVQRSMDESRLKSWLKGF